jgi:nucleoside 2-deoxyribosyltransferase
MRAYIAIKYHEDNSNRPRIEAIARALEACGFETVCIARDVEGWGEVDLSSHELMVRTFLAIDGCDLVIVDLTEKGVGVGIEAGYAYAQGKQILTIAQRGSDISATLRGISTAVLLYDRTTDLPRLLGPNLGRE